ncbi:MAG TPA: DUF2442 domain-containing protein [Turneriella sp.]|nr:DUF2442 domain-containing protein [Turneriella sp.]
MPGTSTLAFEITNIERYGFWILIDEREYFVSFDEYPIFKEATLQQILDVERPAPNQFHWPSLDADIELEALQNPKKFTQSFKH